MLLFVVYLASIEPVCPMKKTRKSCAIFPLDSAINSCVSKNALSTYGLHLKRGLIAFLTSYSILAVDTNFFPLFFPQYVTSFVDGDITELSGVRISPAAIL